MGFRNRQEKLENSAFFDLKKFEICWMAGSWSELLQVINIDVITSFVISRFCGTSMAFLRHVFENKYLKINTSSFKLQFRFIFWCWNNWKKIIIGRKMGKPTKNTLLKQILTKNILKCDMCSLQFDSKYAYDLHWSLVHSTPNVHNINPKSKKVK